MSIEESQTYLEQHAKLTTTKCILHLNAAKLFEMGQEEDERLMQDYRSIKVKKSDYCLFKSTMQNIHGPLTDEQLEYGPVFERFYTLLNNDVKRYMGEVSQDEEDGGDPLNDLAEHWYGMPRNVFQLAFLLEHKVLRHDQVKAILEDLFTVIFVGIDLYTYLTYSADFLNEPEVDMDAIVAEAIAANPDAVADYKKGKEKALGRIMGAVLKKVKGSPQEIQEKIKAQLGRS